MTAQMAAQPGGGERRLQELRAQLRAATLRPEDEAAGEALADLAATSGLLAAASARAARWVEAARADQRSRPLVERMLEQFPLDSAQGKALMSLAEALLRTPDPKRADQLIAERLATVRSAGVPGDTDLLLRTGFTLLGAAGRLLPDVLGELSGGFSAAQLTAPLIAPVVRAALRQSMQLLGDAFIVGETIDAALARGRADPELALCSFDVLGEGARTAADAQRYFEAYAHAIEALSAQAHGTTHARSGISVKLSALEPRYSLLQSARVNEQLGPRMLQLARAAAAAGIGFTIDAEEADRLDLSLDIVEILARDGLTRDWDGLGLAVQAYGRRAPLVLGWVAELARATGRRMGVRLVKGAYWDSEIKRAQERGLASFPVYTSKAATDASYLECAAAPVRRARGALPAVRHTQCLHGRRGAGAGAARRRVRVPAPARHGRSALCGRARRGSRPAAGARVRAGRHARGAAAVPGAAAARERRQQLLRPPVPESADSGGAGGARPAHRADFRGRGAARARAAARCSARSAPTRRARISATRRRSQHSRPRWARMRARVTAAARYSTAGPPVTSTFRSARRPIPARSSASPATPARRRSTAP